MGTSDRWHIPNCGHIQDTYVQTTAYILYCLEFIMYCRSKRNHPVYFHMEAGQPQAPAPANLLSSSSAPMETASIAMATPRAHGSNRKNRGRRSLSSTGSDLVIYSVRSTGTRLGFVLIVMPSSGLGLTSEGDN